MATGGISSTKRAVARGAAASDRRLPTIVAWATLKKKDRWTARAQWLLHCEFLDMLNVSNSETGTVTMPFKKGQSGNPSGRPRKHIADLSREARRYANLALGTLVKICKEGQERNRLAAANSLLDRGYGRPLQMLDLIAAGRKLSELSADELAQFEARLVSAAADDAESGPAQGDMFH